MLSRRPEVPSASSYPRRRRAARAGELTQMSATHELITTPFGFESTAAEVTEGIDLTGKRAIVTGGASGIGVETARALAAAGAEVTLAVRNIDAGERIAADITAATGNADVLVAPLDLADRASVAAFVAAWDGPLHLLVNNAGVMALPELELTPEGWELQFATNHLGHFALAARPARRARRRRRRADRVGQLRAATCARRSSSTTSTSASAPYDPWLAYGQSKTANVLFAVEATRRWAGDGITANASDARRDPRPTCQRHVDPDDARARCARSRAAVSASRPSSRAPRRACWSRPRRCSRASAAATSRTATRPRRCASGARPAPPPAASPVRARPGQRASGCGTCRWR